MIPPWLWGIIAVVVIVCALVVAVLWVTCPCEEQLEPWRVQEPGACPGEPTQEPACEGPSA
jgi:hypothetical protein